MTSQRICVIGLGYVGLPTASFFATHGFEVIGIDVNDQLVEALRAGDVHSHEPGLNTLVQAAIRSGNLVVRVEPEAADTFVIAVPTPFTDSKTADLSYVEAAARSIVPSLRRGNLVILESTVPPGTTEEFLVPLLEESGLKARRDFSVAYMPERVLPGRIVVELVENDRVVGGIDPASGEVVRDLYKNFVQGEIFLTDAMTAEMIKLMENTCRDVNIALANEFALIAQSLGVDVWEAIRLANRHPRVNILRPGPGVGGHCVAVDPWFLVEAAPDLANLIRLSRQINDAMPYKVLDLIRQVVRGIETPRIACLGVAYKRDVDDVRESPAVKVVNLLIKEGFHVSVFDPFVSLPSINGLPLSSTIEAAVSGADCLILLTDHSCFAEIMPEQIGSLMRRQILSDTRHLLDETRWRAAGFKVSQLGNGKSGAVSYGS